MDPRRIDDRIAWAGNRIARHIGASADAFRPSGPAAPLALRNRYLRLPAAFSTNPINFGQAAGYGTAVCYGHFDSSYTRPGDYLVQADRTYFIASQERLHPIVCVRTNAMLTIRRLRPASAIGSNGYGGAGNESTMAVLQDWPSSVLGMATGGTSQAGLPVDTTLPQWNVLMPSYADTSVQPGDTVTDGNSLKALVILAERSLLGWRITVRQVST